MVACLKMRMWCMQLGEGGWGEDSYLADSTSPMILLGQPQRTVGAVVVATPGHHRFVALLPLPPAAAHQQDQGTSVCCRLKFKCVHLHSNSPGMHMSHATAQCSLLNKTDDGKCQFLHFQHRKTQQGITTASCCCSISSAGRSGASPLHVVRACVHV